MLQRARPGVAGRRLIGAKKLIGQISSAQPFQVDGQGSDVHHGVDMTKGVVELQTVEQARSVIEAKDVRREQIAVPIHRPPLLDPTGEQLLASGDVAGDGPR
jgi:hypothetical protein